MGSDDESRTDASWMTSSTASASAGPDTTGMRSVSSRGAGAALLVAVCLVAANMRLSITAVGPLLDQIGTDTGLSVGTLGLIAAVPLVAWAAVSPFALALSLRFGMSRVVLGSLLVLLAGTIVRSLPGPTVSLWIGTVLIGLALAIANVLMPAVIKRDFSTRVPVVMAAYTGLLGGVGAISSGVAVPLSFLGDEQSGWRIALLVTGAGLLIPAIGVWAWATRGHHAVHLARPVTARSRTGIWRDALAWQVAAYMGFQAATFYMMLTWLAAISTSIGRSEVVAGFDVMIYQLTTIIGSIIVPLLLRGPAERYVPAAIPIVGIAGIAGLMLAPEGIVVWVLIAGLSSGASLSMALTLMAQRARTSDASAALSGMAQSVGYLIAAAGPVLFGWLHAGLGGWNFSLALLILVLVAQSVTGVFAGRPRFVLEHRQPLG
ncbi:MFS transporter [Microbacterium lacus]|uniref:MFS transporter n=1 Tax=Microbacterium lacus TaxID=415217 RepID=UPI001E454EBA|nr:MFS transporter [Microbacterium lacus]